MAEPRARTRPGPKPSGLRDELMLVFLRHALGDERLVRDVVADLLNGDRGRAAAMGAAVYGFADAILDAGRR